MAKIAMIADVHLGVGSRLDDIIWALRTVKEYCHRNDIREVIVLGDLFHDRQSISIEVLCKAYDFFKGVVDQGQQWFAFPGNHDMYLKHSWGTNSLRTFDNVVTLLEGVKILELDDRRFWILPFVYSETAYMRILAQIEKQHKEGDVLLTHIGINTALKNVCFLLQDWSIVTFADSKFKQVFTGHFHLKQQVGGNVWYPGSLIPFKFDEGDSEHGLIVYDLETSEHSFVDIWEAGGEYFPDEKPPPNFHTFIDSALDEKTIAEVANNYIRVALTREYTAIEKEGVRKQLNLLGARSVRFLDLQDGPPEIAEAAGESSELRLDDLFERWLEIDEKGWKGLRRNLLIKLEQEVRQEGDELYVSQYSD